MKQLTGWIKKAITTLVDPDQEERIQKLTRRIKRDLKEKGKAFSLAESTKSIEHNPQDLTIAREQVFSSMLEKMWDDEHISDREASTMQWVGQALGLSEIEIRQLNVTLAQRIFGTALAEAMTDGELDSREEERLTRIATSVGYSLPDFASSFFGAQGEAFLRGMFIECLDDNRLSSEEWSRLLQTTAKLGVSRDRMLMAIRPQAERFVEHVLADAKSEGRLSETNDQTLHWMLGNFSLSDSFREYVTQEVSELRFITRIQRGELPSLPPPAGIAIRAGEIIHAITPAIWRQHKVLKSGPTWIDHRGTLLLTDNRIVFASSSKSDNVRYANIISHRESRRGFQLELSGKPMIEYFVEGRSRILYTIFQSALAMSNQTLVRQRGDDAQSRHIPRDVRQRVWQRYGGRCAECQATDYLEFDHIVPVAKGGSNSDANVQLLCRRCNLMKSDRI